VAFSDAYSAKVAGVVGLVHIICGLAALTANIVGIMFGANIPLAAGVWSSIFFVSSGSLALAGACIKTKRLVVSTLVMAILSCLAAVLLLLISSFTLMEDINSSMSSSSIWQELETGSSYTPSINVHSNMTNDLSRERAVHRLRTGVYATEMAVGLLMLVAATLSSALTCHPLCCRGRPFPNSHSHPNFNPHPHPSSSSSDDNSKSHHFTHFTTRLEDFPITIIIILIMIIGLNTRLPRQNFIKRF